MTKVDVKKNYYRYDVSPLDLNFQVEIKFIDEDESVKYAYVIKEGDHFEYGLSSKPISDKFEKCEPFDGFIVECYESLDGAVDSKYYGLLDEVNFELGKYVEDITNKVKDTKYSGPRLSMKLDRKGLTYFVEGCYYISKEDKYYYIQITNCKYKYHYSITSKSSFNRIELGDFYSIVTDDKEEVEYYVSSDDIDDLEIMPCIKQFALKLKDLLDELIASRKDNRLISLKDFE